MSPLLVMDVSATKAVPASNMNPTEHGPHITHQSAALSAKRRSGAMRTQTRKTTAPKTRKKNSIAGTRRSSISSLLPHSREGSIALNASGACYKTEGVGDGDAIPAWRKDECGYFGQTLSIGELFRRAASYGELGASVRKYAANNAVPGPVSRPAAVAYKDASCILRHYAPPVSLSPPKTQSPLYSPGLRLGC